MAEAVASRLCATAILSVAALRSGSVAAAELGGSASQSPPSATIEATLSVSIHSPSLKHWGVPGAVAVFVPNADRSAEASSIRAAANAEELCTALAQAGVRDPAVTLATMEGDGDLQHPSGDVITLHVALTIRAIGSSATGALYACSRPVTAIVSRGTYPDERFRRAEDHRVSWAGGPLTLRPGEQTHVKLTADVDASDW